jgi:NAD(P)-dependent dehydrogenase (short-subunit alcohol dehydrogenase family)
MSRAVWSAASEAVVSSTPVARIGYPEDVANAALYLASDESAWVTGTNLVIDGGMVAGYVAAAAGASGAER